MGIALVKVVVELTLSIEEPEGLSEVESRECVESVAYSYVENALADWASIDGHTIRYGDTNIHLSTDKNDN